MHKGLKWGLFGLVGALVVAGAGLWLVSAASWGQLTPPQGPGEVTATAIPSGVLQNRIAQQNAAAMSVGGPAAKQVVFGDLHVHTTYSEDAIMMSLPLLGGTSNHPPADACDFARYCSQVDFWSINDHAEAITPRVWQATIDSIRACNAVTDPANPDLVTYLGWEWSHSASNPAKHYGHRNIILRDLEDGKIPTRPIASVFTTRSASRFGLFGPARVGLKGPDPFSERYFQYAGLVQELVDTPMCPENVNARDLPADCKEMASSPDILFRKLNEWNLASIAIPHGMAWGFYTPPTFDWTAQHAPQYSDPKRQFLLELFSGHGNSEEYRDWRRVAVDENGNASCPEPSDDYLPSCWRAGEIIRGRCLEQGIDAGECDKRAAATRQSYVDGGIAGFRTVPGNVPDDWQEGGQCTDCFQPTFNHNPQSSVQYIAATQFFGRTTPTQAAQFGFLAASDNHKGRPGTGYKELNRDVQTDNMMPYDIKAFRNFVNTTIVPGGANEDRTLARHIPFDAAKINRENSAREVERHQNWQNSGGLTAVHSEGRTREAIWDAMRRKEVYGTSGDRILLWFDLVNAPGGEIKPMGSSLTMGEAPRFRVRAVGAQKQLPGCQDFVKQALTPERLDRLCGGECYNPSDERKRITRIEVIRIRPQMSPHEKVGELIDDPWKVLECTGDAATGCQIEFDDPEFPAMKRQALYYVRAIEEPSDAILGQPLALKDDGKGGQVPNAACIPHYLDKPEEDCLAPIEERAWSSPIFIGNAGG
jgi:hypothetical protein